MYNTTNLEATCDKCSWSWRSRSEDIPRKCPKCGAYSWNSGSRKYEVLIARSCGTDPETDRLKLCVIPYISDPNFQTADVFYVTREDLNTYLFNKRYPHGSGLIFLGSMEIGENQELKINSLNLVFCFEALMNHYLSGVYCLYNIKSFYERQKALKLHEEKLKQQELIEAEAQNLKIEAARVKLEKEAELKERILEAESKVQNAAVPVAEKMAAIAFLEKVKR